MSEATLVRYTGGCHCGAVRFEAHAPPSPTLVTCNCSMCRMVGFLHLIVAAEHFQLVRGQGSLSEYRFNTKTARHLFCKQCGVKAFYVPRSHPDGYSVNARCLDAEIDERWVVKAFDGAHWEEAIATLRS